MSALKKLIITLSLFISFILILLSFFYTLINFNIFKLKDKLYTIYPNIELRKYVFKEKSILEKFNNDYNIKFLPKTQFENLTLIKKKINFTKSYSSDKNKDKNIAYKQYGTFFIDLHKEDIFLTDYLGSIYIIKDVEKKLTLKENELKTQKLKTNLKVKRVFDSFIYENKIYISFTAKSNNCKKIKIKFANINKEILDFEDFFESEKCNELGFPGKIQMLNLNGKKGLIFSTAEGAYNKPTETIQDNKSIFGKILFIPLDKSKYKIFSKGHRVIQGLYSDQKIVISTEHGPRGGDEINKIFENGNYGWPISSYGEKYDFFYGQEKIEYKKSHKKYNFIEPIFSFIEGIGISDIVKIPNEFSIYYDRHFALASLNGKSIYFIRFTKNLEKILTIEKIFINSRIRDLKFSKNNKILMLALEEKGEIGFLIKK